MPAVDLTLQPRSCPLQQKIVLGAFLMQHISPEAFHVLPLFYSCRGCWQCVITILCMLCKGPGGVQLKTLGAYKSCMGDGMKSHCCCPVVANNHLRMGCEIATSESGHMWPNIA